MMALLLNSSGSLCDGAVDRLKLEQSYWLVVFLYTDYQS